MFKKSAAPAVAAGGYTIAKSLRFRSSASAYLNRTLTTPTSSTLWTWSCWVKRGSLGSGTAFFGVGSSAGPLEFFSFASDKLYYTCQNSGSTAVLLKQSTAVFRDPSAWYHIVVQKNASITTGASAINMYVNGVQITAWDTNGMTAGAAGSLTNQLNTAVSHTIGQWANSNYLDGYLTEVNFVDGQALTPSSFGSFSGTGGVWQPIAYTGTYGTNGFYLKFTNTSSTATLGNDSSGNSNTWTVNNISLTAGATYDSMTDVPTLTSATAANYCVMNPLNIGSASSLSNGNLTFSASSSIGNVFQSQITSTIGVSSGKFYWEFVPTTSATSGTVVGIALTTRSMSSSPFGAGAGGVYVYVGATGNKNNGATDSAYGASFTNNNVIGVAYDADAGTLTFYKNNTSQGTAFTGISGTYMPYMINNGSSETTAGYFNFGQQPFVYTPPSGYVALNTYNL
jgi:hypothetical protein